MKDENERLQALVMQLQEQCDERLESMPQETVAPTPQEAPESSPVVLAESQAETPAKEPKSSSDKSAASAKKNKKKKSKKSTWLAGSTESFNFWDFLWKPLIFTFLLVQEIFSPTTLLVYKLSDIN